MHVTAIIPAAGSGSRMQMDTPKQFLVLGDKQILFHTVRRVAGCAEVQDIIVAAPRSNLQFARLQYEEVYKENKSVRFIEGGADRQETVYRALAALPEDCDLVVIHDGVRPFVPKGIIAEAIKAADITGAATAAVKSRDSVKLMRSEGDSETLDRDTIYLIQTPQAFKRDVIIEAHISALESGFKATDDTALVERLGYKVALVEGHPLNIKITTPEDLAIAPAILRYMSNL